MWKRTLVWALLIGAVVGAGHFRLERRIRAAEADRAVAIGLNPGTERWIEARVDSRRARSFADEVELADVAAVDGLSPVPRRLRLRVPSRDERAVTGLSRTDSPSSGTPIVPRSDRFLVPGRRVRLGVRIAPIWPWRNPGAGSPEQRMARQGLAARASLVDPAWIVALHKADARCLHSARPRSQPRDPCPEASAALPRASIRNALGRRLAHFGDDRGLVRALALGDRSGLSRTTREAFQRLGLSHLLAVSGLHVGIVAGLAGMILMRLQGVVPRAGRDPRGWVLSGSVASAVAFAAWAGGAVSAQRAAGGLALGLGGLALRRSISPAALLTCAGLVLIGVEPARGFEVGTQLSFGACAGLILGGVWRGTGKRPLGSGWVGTVA